MSHYNYIFFLFPFISSDICFMCLCFFVNKVCNGLWCLLSLWIVSCIIKNINLCFFKINKLKKNEHVHSTETDGLVYLRFQHCQVWSERLFPLWAWWVSPSWDSLCGKCEWRVMTWQGIFLWGPRTFSSPNSQRLCPLLNLVICLFLLSYSI